MVSPFIKQANLMVPFVRDLIQTWIATTVLTNVFGISLMLGYSSVLLPALKAPDSPIKVDIDTSSWIASSAGVSQLIGLFASAYIMHWQGRRFAHAVAIIPGVLGWILIYFSSNVSMLIIARVLNGTAAGASVSLCAVIIGEYTSPEYRGVYLNLKTTSTVLSSLVIHFLGNFVHWRTLALLCIIPAVLCFIMTFTLCESPSWLAANGLFKKSEESFYWLRGKNSKSIKEFEALIRAQKLRLSIKPIKLSLWRKTLGFFKMFTLKEFLKPLFISIFGFFLLEACGRHTFPTYASDFIGGINNDKSLSVYYILAIDIITLVSTGSSCVLVKIMKRRTLLFLSGFSSLFIMINIILYLFLASKGIISNERSWIPLSLLAVFFILVNFGCTPIPLALLGEIFPLAYRSVGSSLGGISLALCFFIALKITPAMLDTLDVYGTFGVYALIMAFSLLYLYFTLPETKNKTLQEIEDFFIYGKFVEDEDANVKKNVETALLEVNM